MTDDGVYFLSRVERVETADHAAAAANHGNYIVSLNKLVKWLGGLVEKEGVNLFTQFAGKELIYEASGIAGVITDDKGVDKNGKPKDNFTPGYELRAKVTVLAEGTARIADQGNGQPAEARRPESAGLRHRNQGIVGSAAGPHRRRICGAHARLAARNPRCTAADGFTACATIASRSAW